jgi:hypothetical protein
MWRQCLPQDQEFPVPYKLVQLAAGAYDIDLDGDVVPSLVVTPGRTDIGRWTAELLSSNAPTPFTASVHMFATFSAILTWLGDPEVLYPPDVVSARGQAA